MDEDTQPKTTLKNSSDLKSEDQKKSCQIQKETLIAGGSSKLDQHIGAIDIKTALSGVPSFGTEHLDADPGQESAVSSTR